MLEVVSYAMGSYLLKEKVGEHFASLQGLKGTLGLAIFPRPYCLNEFMFNCSNINAPF